MTHPTWPADLPRPMRDGYASVLADGRQSTKTEAGPPRVRRRFSAAVATRQMTIDVSIGQRMRFRRFWTEDTRGGSLPWWIPDWTIDGIALADDGGRLLTDEAGRSILVAARSLVLFGTSQAPSETPIGVRWRIAFQIDVMP